MPMLQELCFETLWDKGDHVLGVNASRIQMTLEGSVKIFSSGAAYGSRS